MGHQLGRDANNRLASGDQVPFKSPYQVPAILDRPQPLLCQIDRPFEQSKMILCRRTNGFHSSEPTTSSTVTAVWLRLCASIPMTIMEHVSLHRGWHGPVDRHIPIGATPRSS